MDITQSRHSETFDGLHFLSGYEEWRGHVASTYVQVWLNQLLGSCKSDVGHKYSNDKF